RQVDAARQDHESHAHRRNAEEGVVGQQVADHAGRQHVGKLQDAGEVGEQEDRQGRDEGQVAGVDHGAVLSALTGSAVRLLGFRKPSRVTIAGDCSVSTRMMMPALMTRLNSGGKPETRMPVLIDWMIRAPMSAARIEKRPPFRELPPITTARMASSSSQSPALLASAPRMSAVTIMPASAAQSPATT